MSSSPSEESGFTSILDIGRVLWAGRLLIVAVAAVSGVAGVSYAFLATEVFKAEVVLAPAERNRMSEALGQFSGLASLAGVNLRSGSDPTPLAVLRSREFAIDFVSDPKKAAAIRSQMGGDEDVDIRDVADFFDRRIRYVEEDKRLGLVTLSIKWVDPDTAAEWANLMVNQLNDKLRDRALVESTRNVDYLRREIAVTAVPSLQQSLGRVMEFEMQKLMLARGNDEFAFKIVDKAIPPRFRASPQRSLVVLLSILIGLSLGAVLTLSLTKYRRVLNR
jgi:uncharacterized protein involved in exopolysaccharide biosynthesis